MTKRRFLIFSIIFLINLFVFSQYYYWYYGKNKFMKKTFDWKYFETQHFHVYHYTENINLIKKIMKTAEESYAKISNYLNVRIKRKIPLIYYKNHIDFEQTNIIRYMPPTALGFAEPQAFRIVIQGDLPFAELSHLIMHEIGHLFEYELQGPRNIFRATPLWVTEGFSEFVTFEWDDFNLLRVRDTVLTDRIPQMRKSGYLTQTTLGGRSDYEFGHIIYEFINKKFGKRGVKKILYSLKGKAPIGKGRNPLKILNYSAKKFNHEFGKYLRTRFKKFHSKENPEDYSEIIGPDFPFVYSFSHQVSPSGELLAVLTVNIKSRKLDFILISMKDGKIIKNITPGYMTKYDNINLKFNPAEGITFSWNNSSDKIAFFVRKELNNYFVLMDILNGKISKQIKLKEINDPSSPDFHPGDKTVYFTGINNSKAYIYSIDIENGEVKRLTDGKYFIRSLNISPDGKKIVFSAKIDKYYKLFLGPIEKPEVAKKITTGNYDDITPVFSQDSKIIYYSSSEFDAYNINSLDLQEKTLCRYTDVRTGNFFPIEIPEENKVIISSYHKGSFILFKKDMSDYLEKRNIEFEEFQVSQPEQEIDIKSSDVEIKIVPTVKKYQPLKKLYVKAVTPVSISMGTDGNIWGYSYINLSDLLGDHNFYLIMSSYYGYRSFNLTYLNMKNRLQYYGSIFYLNDAYYYLAPGSSYYSQVRRLRYGASTGFIYPFNRSYRAEMGVSLYKQQENLSELWGLGISDFGQYFDGPALPAEISLTGETTRFSYYGPITGHTFRIDFKKYFKVGSAFLDAYTVQADFRKYFRIAKDTLLAFRLSAFKSGGPNSLLYWTGGNNTIRAAGYRQLVGDNVFHFNAEFRFPLVDIASTILGRIGPFRGVFFFDVGGVWLNEYNFRFFEEGQGLKLQDAVSSYGFGFQFFLFGYPFHLEWVYQTNLESKRFYKINLWIGFDF